MGVSRDPFLTDFAAKVESDYPINKIKKNPIRKSDKQKHRESTINTIKKKIEKKISVRLRNPQSDGYNRINAPLPLIHILFKPLKITLPFAIAHIFCQRGCINVGYIKLRSQCIIATIQHACIFYGTNKSELHL